MKSEIKRTHFISLFFSIGFAFFLMFGPTVIAQFYTQQLAELVEENVPVKKNFNNLIEEEIIHDVEIDASKYHSKVLRELLLSNIKVPLWTSEIVTPPPKFV